MNLFFLNSYLARFSIQQKLWGGIAMLLLVLAIVAGKALISLSDTSNKMDVLTEDIQPTLIAAMELQSALKEATTALGFFLLTTADPQKHEYQQLLKTTDDAMQALKTTPIASTNDNMRKIVLSIEQDVGVFQAFEGRMIELAENLTENFHALGFAGDNLNPINRDVLQTLSNMILSESDEEVTPQRKALFKTLTDLRYAWTNTINNTRIYISYANEDALANVTLFVGGVNTLIDQVEALGGLLTFEQEDGIAQVRGQVGRWEQELAKLIEIQNSEQARMDAYLIKTEVSPLLSRIDKKLNMLVHDQQQSTLNTGNDLKNQAVSMINQVSLLLLSGLIIGVFIAFIMARVIVKPIRVAVNAMEDIAEGEGDLGRRLSDTGSDEIAQLSRGFNRFAAKIQDMIKQIAETVVGLSASADELVRASQKTNAVVSEQKSETEHIATAICQMQTASEEVAKHAELTAQAARSADDETNESRKVVSSALVAINELVIDTEATADVIEKLGLDIKGIGDVVDVIRGVTDQTNLLALNATIEAARAGDLGRGFAVVADEVRTLADRTKQSTNEIHTKIASLQSYAENAVVTMISNRDKVKSTADLATSAGRSLDVITSTVTKISEMTHHIATAAEEQSAVTIEINRFTENVSLLADQANSAALDVTACSSTLGQVSNVLSGLVSRFKH